MFLLSFCELFIRNVTTRQCFMPECLKSSQIHCIAPGVIHCCLDKIAYEGGWCTIKCDLYFWYGSYFIFKNLIFSCGFDMLIIS